MATVRAEILARVKAALEGLAIFGRVAAAHTASEEEISAVISPTDAGNPGKAFVEMYVFDDERTGPKSNIEMFTFVVGLVIHLPNPLPSGGLGQPRDPLDVASDYCAQVYMTYAVQPGSRWDNFARDTRTLGGGGVYLDGRVGTLCTAHAFEVDYAHGRGQPELPS